MVIVQVGPKGVGAQLSSMEDESGMNLYARVELRITEKRYVSWEIWS